ncbi:hypothetical protein J5N97_016253 [Dioscorea zingiberensis]|uniref:Uncharacterized protein n=1 Tax=Dioscorea zingiberensis TaxID=325984 RepID=A0A9D5CKP9_9LILI|nr:hypothetical protein J5N97_016253 [Dioscorea zingiberensis]
MKDEGWLALYWLQPWTRRLVCGSAVTGLSTRDSRIARKARGAMSLDTGEISSQTERSIETSTVDDGSIEATVVDDAIVETNVLDEAGTEVSVVDDASSEQSWMLRSLSDLPVACVTGDFAMQNVILQIGLRLLAPGGMQIQLHRWVSNVIHAIK